MHTSVSGRSWYGGGHASVAPIHKRKHKRRRARLAVVHPRRRSFGVVRPRDIKYRVHMCPSLDDPLLLRLNTDVWEYM